MARTGNAEMEPPSHIGNENNLGGLELASISSRDYEESLGRKSRRILAAERRSLHVDDRIPVVVLGRDLEPDGIPDFQEFHQWVLRADEEAASQGLSAPLARGDASQPPSRFTPEEDLCVVGQDGKPLKVCKKQELSALLQQRRHPCIELTSPRASSSRAPAAPPPPQQPDPGVPIAVPKVREITPASVELLRGAQTDPGPSGRTGEQPWKQQQRAGNGPVTSVSSSSASRGGHPRRLTMPDGDGSLAYIRYKHPSPEELDAAVEYDLDDEDEEWLEQQQRRRWQHRRRTRGVDAAGAGDLAEEDLELMIDRLEKEYCREMVALGKEALRSAAEGSLTPAKVLPLETALPRLPERLREPWGAAVHKHWVSKARPIKAGPTGAEYPLLPRLRSHLAPMLPRWPIGNSNAVRVWVPELPFMGRDKSRLPQRTLDAAESYTNMRRQRKDIEVVRILVNQVSRRERLKRAVTRTWVEELRTRASEASARQHKRQQRHLHHQQRQQQQQQQGAAASTLAPEGGSGRGRKKRKVAAEPSAAAAAASSPSISAFRWVEYDSHDTAVLRPSPPPREPHPSSPEESKEEEEPGGGGGRGRNPDGGAAESVSDHLVLDGGQGPQMRPGVRVVVRVPPSHQQQQQQHPHHHQQQHHQQQGPQTPSAGDLQGASKRQHSSESGDEAASRPSGGRSREGRPPPQRQQQEPQQQQKQQGPPATTLTELRGCSWCSAANRACVVCRSCDSGFCYQCVRGRKGMGVRAWAAAIRNDRFKCEGCCAAGGDDDKALVPSETAAAAAAAPKRDAVGREHKRQMAEAAAGLIGPPGRVERSLLV